ncbi:MAG TPA: tetratricopeptide repeat protein [Longimicrobium sp.]
MNTKAFALAAAALLSVAAAAPAQRVRDVPARPALWAGADSNSANVYYLLGVQRLEREPRVAAAAFYWAERLNPGWPQALYGRRIALMMTDERRLVDYIEGKRSLANNPEVLAIDSLVLRALQRDPFLHQQLDRPYLMMYFRKVFSQGVQESTGQRNDALAEYALNDALLNAGPAFKAWMDYASGRFPAAIQGYERALRGEPHSSSLRIDLARLHYLSGEFPRAAQYLREAIDDERGRDRRDIVRVYESKGVMEFSRAVALEQGGDAAGAREGYGRALTEDLAFWPAHRRLALLALAAGDTAAANSEMALAVEIAPNEADLRYERAVLQLQTRQIMEAAAELQKAVELDPYYAAPHYLLALMHDQSEMPQEALEHYRHFLARAANDDANRARVEARVAELSRPAAPTP